MKKIIFMAIGGTIGAIGVILFAAFVGWGFDPSGWDPVTRFFFALFSLFGIGFGAQLGFWYESE